MNQLTFCEAQNMIAQAKFLASPYCDDRPQHTDIDLLVIHCISLPPGEFGAQNVQRLFMGQLDLNEHPYYQTIPTTKVSSHLYIDRDGILYQFVPFHKRAWHAGVSEFNGRQDCNDFSIGIELEGTEMVPYTSAQYQCLSMCTKLLMAQYQKITEQRIVGHSDIAPGRKTDPGESFDWNRYRQLLQEAA